MRRARSYVAALAALSWSMPGAAQVASASAKAGEMAGMIIGAAAAIGTLVLVISGYFLMTGHGDRQTFALWAAGFGVLLAAPYIAGLLT
jgi:hypothetical protein